MYLLQVQQKLMLIFHQVTGLAGQTMIIFLFRRFFIAQYFPAASMHFAVFQIATPQTGQLQLPVLFAQIPGVNWNQFRGTCGVLGIGCGHAIAASDLRVVECVC